ncbi:MAG: hypothetical protein IPN85_01600 [Flavobacteriales bacterium]|nr:hypothetical protein [Flavobacteriales bacterium]
MATRKYSLQCVGNYFDASTPELFYHVLRLVISQALNNTTTTLHLLDVNGKPKETNVPVTFYDQRTGQQRYNFVHTMNQRGVPDTLTIDPMFTYQVVAHTVPPSVRENVRVKAGVHNIIALDAGRARWTCAWARAVRWAEVACIVPQGRPSDPERPGPGHQPALPCGRYDLEVLTLPRLMIPDVEVKQRTTTPIVVPQPVC